MKAPSGMRKLGLSALTFVAGVAMLDACGSEESQGECPAGTTCKVDPGSTSCPASCACQ